jgi:regulator of cell morphogenesis and NO signaling
MTITDQTSIGELAAAIPGSVRVCQRHGLDFCCGGRKPVVHAPLEA